jgi:hypothetical protein
MGTEKTVQPSGMDKIVSAPLANADCEVALCKSPIHNARRSGLGLRFAMPVAD